MLCHRGISSGVALSFSLLATGCNPFTRDQQNKNNAILPQRIAPADGVRWLLPEDPTCIEGNSSTSLSEITIYEWNGVTANAKQVPMRGSEDIDGGFETDNIFHSILNYTQNSTCTYDDAGLHCTDDPETDSGTQKKLRICRANGTYDRDSLEAMTLTAQYYTESSYQFYNSITGGKPGLIKSVLVPQPRLKMHVTITSTGKTGDVYDTDNAAFTSVSNDKIAEMGAFLVHPTSLKSFGKNGVNLWEVPFVMHHEFGHHVWRHYLKSAVNSAGFRLSEITSIDGILPDARNRHRHEFGLTATTSNAQLALDGINETVADLFAYFAANSAKDQLKGVELLDTTRDPGSPVYTDGSKKGMNADAIATYEGRMTPADNKDSATPNFDDEHDIAEALGQPIANFIELSFPNTDGKTRAQIILDWLTRLDPLIRGARTNIRIDNIVRELVLTVKEKAPLKADACEAFKANITGLPLATAACAP